MTSVSTTHRYGSTDVGVAPCVGCAHSEMCKTEQLACRDFLHYVNSNRLSNQDRAPSRAMYRKIFEQDPHV